MQIIKYSIMFLPLILWLALGLYGLIDGFLHCLDFIMLSLLVIVFTVLYNVMLFVSFSRTMTEYVPKENVRYDLVTTKFNNSIDGNFFLGIGTIENKEHVNYTVKEGVEIIRKKIDNYQIFISNEEPYVIVDLDLKREITTNWLYDINNVTEEIVEQKATFYIPENSIIQNINID